MLVAFVGQARSLLALPGASPGGCDAGHVCLVCNPAAWRIGAALRLSPPGGQRARVLVRSPGSVDRTREKRLAMRAEDHPLDCADFEGVIPDTGPAPATMDFTPAGLGTNFSSLTPALGQVFFIGDGFNSVPEAQQYIAPAVATRLFLGIPDGFGFVGQSGAYDDNDGFYGIDLDVSLQVAIDIKFCSDPNAFNCKKKGALPVTIFGTSEFDVEDIDISSLQLCTEDLLNCTNAPVDWSVADRGDPTLDLGAAMCDLDPLSGLELDYTENQDGFLDLDAAFDAREVQDVLGAFCSDEKGASSEPLVITGTTLDGITIFSVPVPNVGTDQLWKANK